MNANKQIRRRKVLDIQYFSLRRCTLFLVQDKGHYGLL
jgi:hypothetical protein